MTEASVTASGEASVPIDLVELLLLDPGRHFNELGSPDVGCHKAVVPG